MRKSSSKSPEKESSARRDKSGHRIHNEVLLKLPANEFAQIADSLEFVELPSHEVLHEAGEPLNATYFCNSGMFSVLTIMPDGKSVEVGLLGNEGFSAIPLIAGFRTTNTRTVAQVPTTAFRLNASRFRTALNELSYLSRQAQRRAVIVASQAMQIAACNRLHEVEERLARWLLMSHDRIRARVLPLTQDFLAPMLGSRRSSVSVAAAMLRRAGFIEYDRGSVTVVDLKGLKSASCDCYAQLQRQTAEWENQQD
jgi:CRP-like cAMP-binding protein